MDMISRLRPYWAWGLAVVVLAGAGAIVLATGPDAGAVEARVGQFVSARPDGDTLTGTGRLLFPRGSLTVAVTDPAARPDDYALRDWTAPEDGSFVGVDADFTSTTEYAIAAPRARQRPAPVLRLVVLADGNRYPLRAPEESTPTSYFPIGGNAAGYLAVPGRPRDVRVEATLDGVTQTVRPSTGARDPGRAAGMYSGAQDKELPISCGSPTLSAGYRFGEYRSDIPECTITGSARSAYVRGLGWAAPGHTWQLVYLDVERRLEVSRDGREYASVYGDDDLTVLIDGRRSAGSPRANAGADSDLDDAALAAVQVTSGAPPVTVRVVGTWHRLAVADDGPSTPQDPDVRVSWTETLR